MAGELHHNLRRNADRQHEADECAAPAVGGDERVFRHGDIFPSASAEARHVNRSVEPAHAADFFQMHVQPLVTHGGKGACLLQYRPMPGNVVIVKGKEFLAGEKDYRLERHLKDGPKAAGVLRNIVPSPLRPSKKCPQNFELLPYRRVFHARSEPEVADKFRQPFPVEAVQGNTLAEVLQMKEESAVNLLSRLRPAGLPRAFLHIT